MTRRVLLIDDDADFCELAADSLRGAGFAVQWHTRPADAMMSLGGGDFDVVLTDIHLEAANGLDLCARLTASEARVPVVVMTGFGGVDSAIAAIRAGAYDYVTKPISFDELSVVLDRATKHRRLRAELAGLLQRLEVSELPDVVGNSPAIARVAALVSQVSPSDTSILITGESGTGKELVAKAIHTRSGRRGPFLAINCAAIPETLLESELFGHSRGAFTDATSARTGLFVAANGGSVLLDEIGDLPLEMQAKLLRALQERRARPLGGSVEVPFDVRLIAATNRDLESEVEERRFREDLYYRVNVVKVEVPPLRARGSDVLLLAQHFLLRAAERSGKKVRAMSPSVAERLLDYGWPGNVRELENCIERAVALACYEELTVADLPREVADYAAARLVPEANDDPSVLPSMQTVEDRYITRVLQTVAFNKTLAAKILGFDRRTLYRKLARLKNVSNNAAGGPSAEGNEPLPPN